MSGSKIATFAFVIGLSVCSIATYVYYIPSTATDNRIAADAKQVADYQAQLDAEVRKNKAELDAIADCAAGISGRCKDYNDLKAAPNPATYEFTRGH